MKKHLQPLTPAALLRSVISAQGEKKVERPECLRVFWL